MLVRPRRASEPLLPYRGKELTTIRVAVQRLVLLLPADHDDAEVQDDAREQDELVIKAQAHHVDVWWPRFSENEDISESNVNHINSEDTEAYPIVQAHHVSLLGADAVGNPADSHAEGCEPGPESSVEPLTGLANPDVVEISTLCPCLDLACCSSGPCPRSLQLGDLVQPQGAVDLVPEEFSFENFASILKEDSVKLDAVSFHDRLSGV